MCAYWHCEPDIKPMQLRSNRFVDGLCSVKRDISRSLPRTQCNHSLILVYRYFGTSNILVHKHSLFNWVGKLWKIWRQHSQSIGMHMCISISKEFSLIGIIVWNTFRRGHIYNKIQCDSRISLETSQVYNSGRAIKSISFVLAIYRDCYIWFCVSYQCEK